MTLPAGHVATSDSGSFMAELKRRRVVRVGLAYMGVALGVLEVAERIFLVLVLPELFLRLLVIALVASLPFVLVLAWLFDLTPKGIELTTVEGPTGAMDPTGSTRFTRQLVVASAIVVIAMMGLGWRYMPSDRLNLVGNRVAVAPFENITGDPDLEPEGRIVALHVTRNLGRIEGLDVVPSEDFQLDPVRPSSVSPDEPAVSPRHALAERTKAGLIIVGSYYLAGRDLVYQTEVYDAAKQEIVFAAEPVRADPDDPTLAFPLLLDGLFGFMGSLGAALVVEETGAVTQSSRAPSYAAYKEYALGAELVRDHPFQWEAQLAHLDSAVSLDSTFVDAMILSALVHSRWDPAGAPPILARIESMRTDLTRYERANLDLVRAGVAGDLEGAYRAAAESAELAGTSASYLLAGRASARINHPKDAIGHLLKYDRARIPIPTIWMSLASAFHTAGRHGSEIRLLRQGLELYPDFGLMRAAELRALAAQGNGVLVLDRLAGSDMGGLSVGLILGVTEELDAHDAPESARTLRERLLEREGARPLEERENDVDWGLVLLSVERHAEAGTWFRSVLLANPDDLGARIGAAIAAARTGDREYAEETIEWLGESDVPYEYGRNTLNQARIAGTLGDAQRTVRFLQRAFEQGSQAFSSLHRNPVYGAVRSHPAFQDFMRPRG